MIKLTEYIDGVEKSHLYNESTLVIGDGEGGLAHLCFPGKGLKAEHLRIYREGTSLFIVNLANDPFATLNGYAFRKRKITSGDIIKLKHVEIIVNDVNESLKEPLQAKERGKEDSKDPPINIEEELQKLEPLDHEGEMIHTPSYPMREKPKSEFRSIKMKSSLKDSDHDLFKERKNLFYSPKTIPFRHLKIALCLFLGLLILMTVILGEAYLRLAERSDEEELKAAESLSDIAMALTYAQLYHINSQKHNWSDPEFIQNNLLATLPTGTQSTVKLSPQGCLNNCSYLVRIYTSNDLSHFLLVAHPAPSLLQGIVPKNTIIIDSSSMELRKISDLKHLNRLLANLNTFDGANAKEITALVKKGEIITLSFLARAIQKPEFAPPRAIAFLKPGAENLIYNAPRYHQFSNSILQKAHHFSSLTTSSHELQMLQSEMEVLKKLPHLILYTTESKENAQKAMIGLKAISPETKFLFVHLKLDPEGDIRSSEIILPSTNEAPIEKTASAKTPQAIKTVHFPITPVNTNVQIKAYGHPHTDEIAEIDSKTEVVTPSVNQRIKEIEKEKDANLNPFKVQVQEALTRYLTTEEDSDFRRFTRYLNLYEEEKLVQNGFAKDKLFDLAFEYEDLTPADFLSKSSSPSFKMLLSELYFIDPPEPKKNLSLLNYFKKSSTTPPLKTLTPPLRQDNFP